jgi:hypothetical protein
MKENINHTDFEIEKNEMILAKIFVIVMSVFFTLLFIFLLLQQYVFPFL